MADSELPAGVPAKSGGSGGVFIALSIVMVLAAAGLLYWRFGMGGGTKVVEQKPAEPLVEEPVDDDKVVTAAPPPPEIVPTASASAKEATSDAPSTGGGGGAGPCTCKTAGNDTPDLRARFAGKSGAARNCYNQALARNDTLAGQVTVAVTVGTNGQVCGVQVVSDTVGSGVAQCVAQVYQSTSFPKPQGGCVTANVPFNFKAQ